MYHGRFIITWVLSGVRGRYALDQKEQVNDDEGRESDLKKIVTGVEVQFRLKK